MVNTFADSKLSLTMNQFSNIFIKSGIICSMFIFPATANSLWASEGEEDDPEKNLLLDLPSLKQSRSLLSFTFKKPDVDSAFKPKIKIGALLHMHASLQQDGYSNSHAASFKSWTKGFVIHRARILVGGELSSKGSFFIETEIPTSIGTLNSQGKKNVTVSQILLDAQYQHVFSSAFQLIAGKQLVSNNRNGLQGAGALLTSDFSPSQYRYNMNEDSPLQGSFGRDLGLNARGFLFNDRFEYRLGAFTGRSKDGKDPLRYVGRFSYNFFQRDEDYYYTGTSLSTRKLFSWAWGFDTQSNYQNYSTDVFLDYPFAAHGALTLNAAFQYMDGGTSSSTYSFASLIPRQRVEFIELGYYFKKVRLQPWLKFENIDVSARSQQTRGLSLSEFNKEQSSSIYGAGLNYYFNDLRTNLRLSYLIKDSQIQQEGTKDFKKHSFSQAMLQLQFSIF